MTENEEVKKKTGGGGGNIAVIAVLLIILGALIYYFVSRPPAEVGVQDILPKQCAMLMQVDLDKAADPHMREDILNKMKENPRYKEAIEKLKNESQVDFEKDILPWVGNEATVDFFEPPNPKNKQEVEEAFVIAIEVKDMETAKAKVKEIIEKQEQKFTEEQYENNLIYVNPNEDGPSMTFIKSYLVLGMPSALHKCIDAATGKTETLKTNHQFKDALANLPEKHFGMLYVDMGQVAESNKANIPKDPDAEKALKAMTSLAIGVGMKGDDFVAVGFLGLNKDSESQIVRTVFEQKPGLGKPGTVKLFSQDISYYAAVDFKFVYNLLVKVAEVKTGSEQQVQTFKNQFKTNLGVDFDQDLMQNLTGELAYAFDFTDLMAQMQGKSPMKGGQGQAVNNNLRNIATALEMWSVDNQGKYPAKLDVLTPKYLKSIPSPPQGYTYYYIKKNEPATFMLGYTKDGNNLDMDMPVYESVTGLRNAAPQQEKPNTGKKQPPPLVFAIPVENQEKMNEVVSKITGKFGMILKEQDISGTKFYNLPQNAGTFGVYENTLLLGLGLGKNRVESIVSTKIDEQKSIANSRGYKMISDQLGEKTVAVNMVKLEKVMPFVELGVGMAAASKSPEQAEAAMAIVDFLKQYNELWSFTNLEDDGFSIHIRVLKKETPKE